ncbi:acyltransferase [Fulvimonas sp. R45]|uniref:LpxL/LpxP family acyltransferase n=1 Tax=Fulvimonas sp. R45 TaxID=3045937 RepID=UPI00265E3565|nr:acyltransferase [Fulvimonas sp. R45]MDO1528852.1 acyltransferase [Fulvimonas sp. R45]
MSGHWRQQPEGGGRFAFWLIRVIALRGGRRLGRLCLYPVTLYYMLRRGEERRASRRYLRRVLGKPPTWPQVFRNLHAYAATSLDRIFLLAHGERGFDIEVEGLAALEAAIDQGRGVLLVGSHQGSFEALRALSARRPDVPLRVLLDKQKTPTMTAMLEALAPDVGAGVIDTARGGAAVTLAVGEACRAGAMVALLADRAREHEALHMADFLGRPAPFPAGPWLLAAALRVPVLLCFGLYLGGNRYRLVFEPFAAWIELPRRARGAALDALVARYAARLEHYARAYPYNWFNFHDFWRVPDEGGGAPG